MAWKFESGLPIYTQIVEHIAMDIVSGIYPPGSKLPSVREFAMIASVNPNTMQKAMSELEDLGLVSTLRSSGRYVTTDESVIKAAGRNKFASLTMEYLDKILKLGYSEADAIDFIRNSKEECANDSVN